MGGEKNKDKNHTKELQAMKAQLRRKYFYIVKPSFEGEKLIDNAASLIIMHEKAGGRRTITCKRLQQGIAIWGKMVMNRKTSVQDFVGPGERVRHETAVGDPRRINKLPMIGGRSQKQIQTFYQHRNG